LEKGGVAVHKFILKNALAVGFMVFAFYGAAFASDPLAQMEVIRPRVRIDAPDFVLRDIEGRQKGLTDFKGKVILLNFWATWCPGCREEMPSLEKLWEKFRAKGVVVVAIAIDRSREEVKSFATDLGLTFPILLDLEGVVRKDYEITALPMTYIIGKDGKISGRMYGDRDWAGENADMLMDHLLRQGI
jgi:peroxiredoxin